MIKIKAKLSLYNDTSRTQPIKTGYRPLFNFSPESKKSGQIELINKDAISVGDDGEVFINLIDNNYVGENIINKKIFFDEGREPLGDVIILEIFS